MSNELSHLERELLAAVSAAADVAAIEQVRVAALGKKGKISELMGQLGKLPPGYAL